MNGLVRLVSVLLWSITAGCTQAHLEGYAAASIETESMS